MPDEVPNLGDFIVTHEYAKVRAAQKELAEANTAASAAADFAAKAKLRYDAIEDEISRKAKLGLQSSSLDEQNGGKTTAKKPAAKKPAAKKPAAKKPAAKKPAAKKPAAKKPVAKKI